MTMNKKLKTKIKDRIIDVKANLLLALKQMDSIDKKLLLVFDEDTFVNLLSIGDIQRAIIDNKAIETQVTNILRKNTRLSSINEPFEAIKEKMIKYRIECMPVIDGEGELVDVYFWEDVFLEKRQGAKVDLKLPVVIMAGGKGTRLQPLTNVIPKPLIPIDSKTIIEHIMDRFTYIGCKDFYISVNYKADMLKYYLDNLEPNNYCINYIKEERPLGTAGSMHLLRGVINQTFFVSNCDIIIQEDYSEIYNYHEENKNELTIVAALKHYKIPYGTMETKENGILESLDEKPELTYKINSGMYILEPHLLDEVPENEFFHITDLIANIIKRGGKVGVFPVSEMSWVDIGEWKEYLRAINI